MHSLIEDYMPIHAIGAESSREKSLWREHPFTGHLWWARRPLVSCRAAVYCSLVPANQWVSADKISTDSVSASGSAQLDNWKQGASRGLNRENARRFVTDLCKYPCTLKMVERAQGHILRAHAQRLTSELTTAEDRIPNWLDEFGWDRSRRDVAPEDILAGKAPRPRVLDMFAGGAAIPLESLRLGCDTFALDLNPVAHIIQLCTLVYPQQFGQADPGSVGVAGPADATGQPTWDGLAGEVGCWGRFVFEASLSKLGHLYQLHHSSARDSASPSVPESLLFPSSERKAAPDGDANIPVPIAYLWTRVVRCKNPTCAASVPLLRQTWLCKKKGQYVALRPVPEPQARRVRFDVVEHATEKGFDFDPSAFSAAGNARCHLCGTVADIAHVKREGQAGKLGVQLLAVVARPKRGRGRMYLSATECPEIEQACAESSSVLERLREAGFSPPDESIAGLDDESLSNSLGITVRPYGLRRFGHLFTPRQLACLLTFAESIAEAHEEMRRRQIHSERAKALTSYLGAALDRLAENHSSLCRWNATAQKMQGTFGRQVITMVWDFCEANPFGGSVGDWLSIIDLQENAIKGAVSTGTRPASVARGTATSLPYDDESMDAVITDPPYYDNVPYADISDFFYVWLKRSVGALYPEHFAFRNTPKKTEAIADAGRHGGDHQRATQAYEGMIGTSLREAHRVLKPNAILVVVYAHKTTLGWSTLVDAMRGAGFMVTEAWPLDTEMRTRLRGMSSSALASSIFLVARKRPEDCGTGSFEEEVRPSLHAIVRERVATLWEQGITGADLVIAAVGAGLRAFTKYERVEFANGEVVPAERFLAEVEGVVLDGMLEQIAGRVAQGVTAIDPRSRFYVLWRYVYKAGEIDAGEAIVFTYGQHVELDGQKGLSSGANPLVEKKKGSYRVRDFAERGKDDKLGLPTDEGEAAPLVDALHRVLWLMEYSPRRLTEFLRESRCNTDQLRVLAQALSGPALKGGEMGQVSAGEELAALTKLTANWRSVIEDALSPLERSH